MKLLILEEQRIILKWRRYPNNNQENDLSEESDIDRSKLFGDGRTTTGGTRSIFISGILTESEDKRNVINNTYTNGKIVQTADVTYSDIDSD